MGRLLTGPKTWFRWRKPGVKLASPQLVIAIFDGNRAMVVTDCWPFRAIAISRGDVAPGSLDLVCIPSFINISIDGEERTGIRLVVEAS